VSSEGWNDRGWRRWFELTAVLRSFPGLAIGVVGASGVDSRGANGEAASFLEQQIGHVRGEWSSERLASDPRIAAGRAAYQAFGAKPKRHHSSMESLLQAILSGRSIPSVNPLVDLNNAISLRHVIPVGGDDLDPNGRRHPLDDRDC